MRRQGVRLRPGCGAVSPGETFGATQAAAAGWCRPGLICSGCPVAVADSGVHGFDASSDDISFDCTLQRLEAQ